MSNGTNSAPAYFPNRQVTTTYADAQALNISTAKSRKYFTPITP